MRLEYDLATHTLYILLPPEGTHGPRVEVVHRSNGESGVGPHPFLPVPPDFEDSDAFALLPVYPRRPMQGHEENSQ